MPSFDSKCSHNRPQLLNTSIQEFNWNELSDKDVIGSGSFGSVITAKYNGKSIVVKQLLEQHERNLRLFYKEANILHSLDDKRIGLRKDYENFARRMRLQYIFFGEDNEPHPFHVKSNWIPPVQKSVALESYLEEVKVQLAEIQLTKPKDNLLNTERKALKTLRENPNRHQS